MEPNMKRFEDYVKHKDCGEEIIKRYKDKVPLELIEFWKEFGFGSFDLGYFKVVNPDEYIDIMRDHNLDTDVPIMVTGLGDIIFYRKYHGFWIIRFRDKAIKKITNDFEVLLDNLLSPSFNRTFILSDLYFECLQILGGVEFDECFGYQTITLPDGKHTEELNIFKIKDFINSTDILKA